MDGYTTKPQSSMKPRYKVTQSLLSAWEHLWDSEDGLEKFLKVLNREPIETTQAMLDGQHFEGLVNAALDDVEIDPDNELYEQVMACKELLYGAQKQVSIFKDVVVDDMNIVLNGVLDFLKAGIIYDTKFSKSYDHVGKYYHSPQHPMYFELVPEATKFIYVICDGKYVYKEPYRRCDIEQPILWTVHQFLDWLKETNLMETFKEKWEMK